jgi:hypothetical protein
MAIIIEQQPELITGIYSQDGANTAIVVSSNNSGECSFKYVGDFYVRGQFVNRIRVSPTLDNLDGVIIPNRVLEDFVSSDFWIPNSDVWQKAVNSICDWEVRIGEESDGTIDCSSSQIVYVGGPTVSRWSWNGTMQYDEIGAISDYRNFYVDDTSSFIPIRFLTNAPIKQNVSVEDYGYLHFLCGMSGSASTPPINIIDLAVRIEVIKSNGTTASYYIPPDQDYFDKEIIMIPTGPAQLNDFASSGLVVSSGGLALSSPFLECGDTYKISLSNFNPSLLWVPDVYTEVFEFNISCGCDRFTPYRFAWLNRLGGVDTYSFRLQSRKSVSITRTEYNRFLSRYAFGDWGYDPSRGDRGRNVYNVKSVDSFSVVSTWQSENEHSWLEELFTSPEVYIVDENGGYSPIIITSNSVSIRDKKGITEKLLSHTIEFQYAFDKIIQRG